MRFSLETLLIIDDTYSHWRINGKGAELDLASKELSLPVPPFVKATNQRVDSVDTDQCISIY